jgi:hypothetical protein
VIAEGTHDLKNLNSDVDAGVVVGALRGELQRQADKESYGMRNAVAANRLGSNVNSDVNVARLRAVLSFRSDWRALKGGRYAQLR